jgi:hypothetical protein
MDYQVGRFLNAKEELLTLTYRTAQVLSSAAAASRQALQPMPTDESVSESSRSRPSTWTRTRTSSRTTSEASNAVCA